MTSQIVGIIIGVIISILIVAAAYYAYRSATSNEQAEALRYSTKIPFIVKQVYYDVLNKALNGEIDWTPNGADAYNYRHSKGSIYVSFSAMYEMGTYLAIYDNSHNCLFSEHNHFFDELGQLLQDDTRSGLKKKIISAYEFDYSNIWKGE